MKILGLSLLIFLLQTLAPARSQTSKTNYSAPFDPRDDILLNCGFSGTSSSSGRLWNGDVNSKYNPTLTSDGPTAPSQDSSVPQVPYLTARLSDKPFSYSFPLGAGRKFLRLHFYPANYTSTSDASNAIFSVTVNDAITLLSNFSAYQTVQALNFDYLIREFSVNVTTSTLNLTFTPSKNYTNSYAFVNGIEILSIPDLFGASSPNLIDGGSTSPYAIGPDRALQTVYRLNVGGQTVSPSQDSGLFRTWEDDTIYMFGAGTGVSYQADDNVTINYVESLPAYIAPVDVYSTARSMGPNSAVNINSNLTWILSIDAGFFYLVRLHFCEIQNPITKMNMRVFDVLLNNQTAFANVDVILLSGGIGNPYYMDFVVLASGSGMTDLWVDIRPDNKQKPQILDAILNGLEVFKLESNGNLAGPNPDFLPEVLLSNLKMNKSKSNVGAIAGGVAGGAVVLLVILLMLCICKKKKKMRKGKDAGSSDGPSGWLPLSLYGNSHSAGSAKTNTTGSYASTLPSNLARHFSFAEIESATNNFNESLLLGVGGFGKVYKGEVDNGSMKVAIKRGNPMSDQGVHEFQTEIEMLSKLRHRHLVSLIGYCEEKGEMILVYDYMAYGTLREHLYKTSNSPLSWKQRLEICIGAARGLHYLHTGAKYTIIHRDVKTTNILLDDKWVAKVSDFGLSKTGPTLDNTHVSTVVKGSFGYLDPEYFRRQQLTDKSDVYSFGVVLFEVLCARPALNPTLPKEQVSLAEWALHCQKKGILDQYVDPFLKGKIAPQCFKKFAETAEKCVSDQGIERPSMGDVLWNLEFALQLQESAEESGEIADIEGGTVKGGKKNADDGNIVDQSATTTTTTTTTASTVSIGGRSLNSQDSDGLTPSAVFSQIMNPKGR